jgi:hypothetical protein
VAAFVFMTGATKTGATMLELMVLIIAATLIPVIVVLGLFRLAGLKRVEDLQSPLSPVGDGNPGTAQALPLHGTQGHQLHRRGDSQSDRVALDR